MGVWTSRCSTVALKGSDWTPCALCLLQGSAAARGGDRTHANPTHFGRWLLGDQSASSEVENRYQLHFLAADVNAQCIYVSAKKALALVALMRRSMRKTQAAVKTKRAWARDEQWHMLGELRLFQEKGLLGALQVESEQFDNRRVLFADRSGFEINSSLDEKSTATNIRLSPFHVQGKWKWISAKYTAGSFVGQMLYTRNDGLSLMF